MAGNLYEVITEYVDERGDTRTALLEARGRMTWTQRTAKRLAKEFTATHGRKAKAHPA